MHVCEDRMIRSEVEKFFYEKFRMETCPFSGFLKSKRLPAKEWLVISDCRIETTRELRFLALLLLEK
jgi:hypothetical protein